MSNNNGGIGFAAGGTPWYTPPSGQVPTNTATSVGGSGDAYALGNAAAARHAYQPDPTQMAQSRQAQMGSLSLAQAAAMGQQPSQAQLLGRNMLDQGMQQQLAGASSAHGGAMAQAAAMRQAAQGAAGYYQQGANALGAQRAQEMATARDQYGQQSGALAQNDLGAAALASQNYNQMAQLNQQGQLGFDAQAIGIDQGNQAAQIQNYGIGSQNWQTAANNAAARQQQETNVSQHSVDRTTGLIGGIVGGAASAGASVLNFLSDENTKQDVQPIGAQPKARGALGATAAGLHGLGKSLSTPGGGSANYPDYSPHRMTSDENAKHPMSLGAVAMGPLAMLSPMAHGYAPQGGGVGGGVDLGAGMTHNELLAAGTGLGSPQPVRGMVGGGGITGGTVNPGYGPAAGGSGGGLMMSDERAKRAVYLAGRAHGRSDASGGNEPFLYEPPGAGEELVEVEPGKPEIRAQMMAAAADPQHFASARGAADANPWASAPMVAVEQPPPQMGQGAMMPARIQQAVPGASAQTADRAAAYLQERADRGHFASASGGMMMSDERAKANIGDAAMMAEANRKLAPSAYQYKPQFTPPDQEPGETNVGPMAQNMASNPLSATAVKKSPDGLLMVDKDKALRLALGSIGSLQQQIDALHGGRR